MNPPVTLLLAEKAPAIRSVSISATVADAVAVMNRHKIGSVMVFDGDHLAGIFTERDVLYRVVAMGVSPATTPVEQVMTRDPKTIPANTTIDEALAFISENRCRHLPVMQDDRMIGLVSQGDITRWLVQAHKAQAEQLIDYITGGM